MDPQKCVIMHVYFKRTSIPRKSFAENSLLTKKLQKSLHKQYLTMVQVAVANFHDAIFVALKLKLPDKQT